MTHDIPHDLDMETAKQAARHAVKSYGERFASYDFKADWKRDDHVTLSFGVAGKTLTGSMTVLPQCLRLELEVPFVFRVFKGKAIAIIEREATAWIDRARRGELPEQ